MAEAATSAEGPAKPLPCPTPVSQGYWDGLRGGRLRLQRCRACGTVRHYPRPLCSGCHSLAVEWIDACGRGVVHSWTVAHHAYHPAFEGEVPYVLVTVDLPEGVRQMGRFEGDPATLRLDLPVTFAVAPTANGYALPVFRSAAAPPGAGSGASA